MFFTYFADMSVEKIIAGQGGFEGKDSHAIIIPK